jgi:hypothetical protein
VCYLPVILYCSINRSRREQVLVFLQTLFHPLDRDPRVWNPPTRQLFVPASCLNLSGIWYLLPRKKRINAIQNLLQRSGGFARSLLPGKRRKFARVDTVQDPQREIAMLVRVSVNTPSGLYHIVKLIAGINETP